MNKLDKVILGMECCISQDDRCDECPYMTGKEQIGEMNGEPEYVYGCNRPTLITDALTLLKSQEPRTETQGRWERVGTDGIVCCSVCGMPMNKTRICFPDGDSGYCYIATKYCPHCGAKNEKGDCDG